MKVNVDAFVPTNAAACLGVAIRTEGSLLLLATRKTTHHWECNMAEVAAARYSMEVARRLGFTRIVLEGDSLKVVKSVRDCIDGASPIFHFFRDIKQM